MDDFEFKSEMELLIADGLPAKQAPKSGKAAPKGMSNPPSEAIHKPDEARQELFPYSHRALIDIAIEKPNWTPLQLAKHFGQTPGWLASMVASDSFQAALDPFRSQVMQTFLTATLEERFRSLTLRSLAVLQTKLDDPKAQDATILKAAELGIKALGLGAKKDDDDQKPKVNSLDKLAQMLEANLAARGGAMIKEALVDDDAYVPTSTNVKAIPQ